MAEVKLNVVPREGTGKGVARRTRAEGRIPGIVYGKGMEPVAVSVDRREFVTALQTDAGLNALLNLTLDGETVPTLAREIQRDPVRGTLLHVDFVKVDLKQEVEVTVPVHVVGESPGVAEGGVLEQPLHEVTVRCLPTEVPEQIEADISGLNIGDSLRVSDLVAGRSFQILNDPENAVISIMAPISEEELAAMEAGVAGEAAEEEEAAEAPEEGAEEGAEADAEAEEGGPGGAEETSGE
jgi:large subunit ribosomal protein L25